jgi:hypothetical protein
MPCRYVRDPPANLDRCGPGSSWRLGGELIPVFGSDATHGPMKTRSSWAPSSSTRPETIF